MMIIMEEIKSKGKKEVRGKSFHVEGHLINRNEVHPSLGSQTSLGLDYAPRPYLRITLSYM
jgi:hypothetical protein